MSREERPRLRPHWFHASGNTDGRGIAICTCGCLRTDAIHRTSEVSEERKAAEARRIGER